MVDFVKGIINLYILSDVIVDVSMLVMICNFGQMWGKDGKQKDIKVVMLESIYVCIYQEMINFCKINGVFDLIIMGSVLNVGLMVQKVEEYGFYDKIFEMIVDGIMCVVLVDGSVLMQYEVEIGDIWCVCQIKDVLICDWVKLVVICVCQFDILVIFWLDLECVYDCELCKKVELYFKDYDLIGFDISIMGYNEVICVSMECLICGKDIILVIGNVLCDYLIDLFLIMELGILVKMFFIVLLMVGGGMYEIGVGGLVFKYVQ